MLVIISNVIHIINCTRPIDYSRVNFKITEPRTIAKQLDVHLYNGTYVYRFSTIEFAFNSLCGSFATIQPSICNLYCIQLPSLGLGSAKIPAKVKFIIIT